MGAVALRDFFEQVLNNEEPKKAAKEINGKYLLTESQKKYFQKITEITNRAKQVVDHLKEKFETDEEGLIIDKNKLYKAVYHKKAPKLEFYAEPKAFTIAFYVPTKYFKNKGGRYLLGQRDWGNIEYTSEYNLRKSVQLKNKYEGLESICFKIDYELNNSLQSEEEKLISAIFGGNETLRKTEMHEIKHIIDNILMNDKPILMEELSADLFVGQMLGSSIINDQEKSFSLLEEAIKRREKMNILGDDALELESYQGFTIRETFERSVERRKRQFQTVDKIPTKALINLNRNGFNKKLLSYIIATTDCQKLNHRLEILDDYIQKTTQDQKNFLIH